MRQKDARTPQTERGWQRGAGMGCGQALAPAAANSLVTLSNVGARRRSTRGNLTHVARVDLCARRIAQMEAGPKRGRLGQLGQLGV